MTAGEPAHPQPTRAGDSPGALVLVTILTGIGAGLGGGLLLFVLRNVQHVAYGYEIDHPLSEVPFLQGAIGASPLRRLVALTVCGIVAGVGCWALRRFGRPFVSVRAALEGDVPQMPPATTTVDSLLQAITVGLGSPVGREVAPRQIGAVVAGWLSKRAGLSLEASRIMVACGAGAGLAAVYNVPLGGGLFALEALLGTFRLSAAIPALVTSVIAAMVVRGGVGDEVAFVVPHSVLAPSLLVWSALLGPLFGVAGSVFSRGVAAARSKAPHDARTIPLCLATFVAIGLLATRFPQILGNGRAPAQLGIGGDLTVRLAAVLLVLKALVVMATFRTGATGGMLTPSLAMGVLLATVLGGGWTTAWLNAPPGAFAVVGGAAFLAAAEKMPLTAVVLIFEFTRAEHDLLFPILLAVGGAMFASALTGDGHGPRRQP